MLIILDIEGVTGVMDIMDTMGPTEAQAMGATIEVPVTGEADVILCKDRPRNVKVMKLLPIFFYFTKILVYKT